MQDRLELVEVGSLRDGLILNADTVLNWMDRAPLESGRDPLEDSDLYKKSVVSHISMNSLLCIGVMGDELSETPYSYLFGKIALVP